MQGGNHCCFSDERNQGLIGRRSRCDPQRMAIQTSFSEKVARFQNTHDCFLAPLGNNGELDLALLNIKNCVRLAALRKNNLVLMILGYRFPSPTLARNVFGSNAAFLVFFTKKPLFPERAQDQVRAIGIGQSYSDPTPKIISWPASR